RYISYLTNHRLVVVQSRGGVIGRRGDGGELRPYNAANIYAIPAAAGSVQGVRRRQQVMKPTGGTHARRLSDGRIIRVRNYAPDVTRPGDQSTIWPQSDQPGPAEAGY